MPLHLHTVSDLLWESLNTLKTIAEFIKAGNHFML